MRKNYFLFLVPFLIFFLDSCGGLGSGAQVGNPSDASGGNASTLNDQDGRGDGINTSSDPFSLEGDGGNTTTGSSSQERLSVAWGTSKTYNTGIFKNNFVQGKSYAGTRQHANFCFNNGAWTSADVQGTTFSLECSRASSSVRNDIGENPVLIQFLRTKVRKIGYKSVSFKGASVVTARLLFDVDSGKPLFDNKIETRFNGGCNLNEKNSIGFSTNESGEERALTGFQLFDEYELFKASNGVPWYGNAFLSSARAWYSGLVPYASKLFKFEFDYAPAQAPLQIDLGNTSYSNASSSDYLTLPKFGGLEGNASDAVPANADRVIIGLCVNGSKTKEVNGEDESRPLFVKGLFRTHRPELQRN